MQTVLGHNIAVLRERKKMTLDDLAKRCGTSKGYIWELENKSPQPSVYLASKIARALGVSTDALISKPIKKAVAGKAESGEAHIATRETVSVSQLKMKPLLERVPISTIESVLCEARVPYVK